MTGLNDHYAFPDTIHASRGEHVIEQPGLTKREYFAAMALQGLLANDYLVDTYRLEECAVEHADRLIRALNQSQSSIDVEEE